MYGALYVVDDLDEYLADAEGYLAKHPLPIKDELLKFVRPAHGVEVRRPGRRRRAARRTAARSANGKQIFQVASCVACHKLDGVGIEFGPDLTKLDPSSSPSTSSRRCSIRRPRSTRSSSTYLRDGGRARRSPA